MIRHTDPYSVSQIFSKDKNIYYSIPKYQREYTWGKKEWGLLFNDVIENDNGYFLGSIISVDTSKSAMGDTVLEVIDGQQRITSLSILLATLYKKIGAHKGELDEDTSNELFSLKKELVLKKGNKYIARVSPQLQNYNNDDFMSLLCELGLLQNVPKRNYAGNRKIYKAYYHFDWLIKQYLEEQKQEKGDEYDEVLELFNLVEKFNSAVIVNIEVETHKDAYMLFESLNNRGVPLSAIDLIKNLLISTSDKDGKADECYEQWKIILGYLGDDYASQERFFRYYYDAYRDELNNGYPVSGRQKYYLGYVATRSNLLDIYETLIKKDYQCFLNEVENKGKVYSILINNNKEEIISEELKAALLNLERIQGAPGYILLLYLLSEKVSLELSDENIVDIVNYLCSFFVRRNLTDYPNTRNLAKIFMETIDIAKLNKGDQIISGIKKYLRENSSSDTDFETKLRGNVYSDNPDATRFLLCYYENKFKTNEIYTDLWTRDTSNKYKWTIEHIFPEGENIPSAWVDMIAGGNKALAQQYLQQYTHTLGNLTITGYNQTLSNMSFERKRDRKNSQDLYVGYRNGLRLNENVVNKESWTINDIITRTDELVTFFIDEFGL